jgi:hypothetical protein
MTGRLCTIVWMVAAMSAPGATGSAQTSSGTAGAPDPIRCWWRTSAGAVAVGESFRATLTCAVREQETELVIADESRLDPAAIQLAPFEVLSGTHPADLRTSTHRFFQYHYVLRLINRDAIGHDVTFPDVHIGYRVQSRAGADRVDGRDRTYVVPGQAVRVLSLVAVGATDIRDSGGADFSDVESLRFRARVLALAGAGLAVLGVVIAIPALVTLVGGSKRRSGSAKPAFGIRRLLAGVASELADVQRECRGQWTADSLSRAAAAVRIAAATGLGREVSTQAVSGAPAEGRLVIRRRWPRATTTTVSSAVTAADLREGLSEVATGERRADRLTLELLHGALAALTRAQYHRTLDASDTAVDQAVADAIAATRALRARLAWSSLARWRMPHRS